MSFTNMYVYNFGVGRKSGGTCAPPAPPSLVPLGILKSIKRIYKWPRAILEFFPNCNSRKIMTRRCKQRLAHYVKRDNIKINNILVWIAHISQMSNTVAKSGMITPKWHLWTPLWHHKIWSGVNPPKFKNVASFDDLIENVWFVASSAQIVAPFAQIMAIPNFLWKKCNTKNFELVKIVASLAKNVASF